MTKLPQNWKINDEVKAQISFQLFNIISNLSILGRFDIIFCRNILMYFDEQYRKHVLNNLKQVMNEGATLFLGSTESAPASDLEFKKITEYNSVYALK